jgi:hypothetical protein
MAQGNKAVGRLLTRTAICLRAVAPLLVLSAWHQWTRCKGRRELEVLWTEFLKFEAVGEGQHANDAHRCTRMRGSIL